MTTAGQLRETVELQRAATTPDGGAGFVRAWSTYAKRRAHVVATIGHESTANEVLQGVQSYRIVIRYGPAVLPSDRLVWGGLLLNVRTAADFDGRRTWLLIIADAGVVTD